MKRNRKNQAIPAESRKAETKRRIPETIFNNRILDFSLGFCGLCLAAVSAYLPWHVHFNSSDFGPPQMAFERENDIDLADIPSFEPVIAASRTPLFTDSVDPIVTGSVATSQPVRSAQRLAKVAPAAPPSPVPNPSLKSNLANYEIVFASRKRALIKGDGEILAISAGSRLPDGRFIASIRKVKGLWVVQTNTGAELSWKP